jgi:hypothetical protein
MKVGIWLPLRLSNRNNSPNHVLWRDGLKRGEE